MVDRLNGQGNGQGIATIDTSQPRQRGYFGVGVENISKPMNAGNLLRSAHAFGAGFFFFVTQSAELPEHIEAEMREVERSDTAMTRRHLPVYRFAGPNRLSLPINCPLIGVELIDDAIELPLFEHPLRAAYILGPERGSLSDEMLARTDACIRIPTRFCINVAMAGALVMYDRLLSLSRAGPRRTLGNLRRTRR